MRPDHCRHSCMVELKQRGLPATCVEAWHMRAALSAMRNKTDKADARGLVSRGLCQERRELPAGASADAAAQSQAQVPRYRECNPPVDQNVRAQTRQGWPRRI